MRRTVGQRGHVGRVLEEVESLTVDSTRETVIDRPSHDRVPVPVGGQQRAEPARLDGTVVLEQGDKTTPDALDAESAHPENADTRRDLQNPDCREARAQSGQRLRRSVRDDEDLALVAHAFQTLEAAER